ncbi:hypothetical protein MCOR06_002246 [Pyricularia oryzae]|nr:hypothetical protein MCOR06_002246 [Pyricularia oryzae]
MPSETGWLYEFEMADEDVPLSFLNKEDYPIEYAYTPQPDLSQYTWLNVEAYQHYVRGNKVGRMVQPALWIGAQQAWAAAERPLDPFSPLDLILLCRVFRRKRTAAWTKATLGEDILV